MAVTYLHGLETIELQDGLRPVQTVKSSIIGLVGTAPDADVDAFPLNKPVAIFADGVLTNKLGSKGTLKDAVNAVFSQGSAVVVVVRVAEGTSTATNEADKAREILYGTFSNAVGSPTAKTGVWALLKSRPTLKMVPKILIAPGITSQRPTSGVSGVTVSAGGTGYLADSTVVTFAAAPAGGRTAKGTAQVVNGAVTGIVITDPGFGYTTAPAVTITGAGTTAAATATLGGVANPVAVALSAIAPRLRAVALVDGPGTSYEDAVAYRNDLGSSRVMVVDPGVLHWDTEASVYVTRPASAYAAGIQARVDQSNGFWHSFSNYEIENVGGPARAVDRMPNDPDSEANALNENQITTVIYDEGFRFWGLRGTGNDSLWAFLAVRRTADMVYESLERAHRSYLDKPFSQQLLMSIQESVNAYLRMLIGRGALIGGQCWIDPAVNTPATFANGELIVDFDLEPPAPLEKLQFRARRNPEYYDEFVTQFSRSVLSR